MNRVDKLKMMYGGNCKEETINDKVTLLSIKGNGKKLLVGKRWGTEINSEYIVRNVADGLIVLESETFFNTSTLLVSEATGKIIKKPLYRVNDIIICKNEYGTNLEIFNIRGEILAHTNYVCGDYIEDVYDVVKEGSAYRFKIKTINKNNCYGRTNEHIVIYDTRTNMLVVT